MTEKILYDSPEAATYRTDIKGWVSRDGLFFGDNSTSEHTARWSGCTHLRCECGTVHEKSRTMCLVCANKKSDKRYSELPAEEWDGETPLALWDDDRFFFYWDDVEEFAEECGCAVSDLKLVLCVPDRPQEVALDYFEEAIPEDFDPEEVFSAEFLVALNNLNRIAREHAPTCWSPRDVRVIFKDSAP